MTISNLHIRGIVGRLLRLHYLIYLVLFIVCGVSAIHSLRHNNLTMIKYRDAVYQADKDNGDVSAALNNLRTYVYGHMNTNLSSGNNGIKPPIQLKYTYERLTATANADAATANTSIYTDAQTYCQTQNSTDFSGRNRVPCIQAYVTSHSVTAATVPTALYEYDFVSPSWSPDLAGWSIVASAVFFVAFFISFALDRLVGRSIQNQV